MSLSKDLYLKIVNNEKIYNKEIGYKITFYNHFKMFLYVTYFIIYAIKSKIILESKNNRKDSLHSIGISWNTLHEKKIRQVDKNIMIFNIHSFNPFKNTYSTYFKDINLFKSILFAFRFKSEFNNYSYDSFFYRIYVHLLYELIFSIIRDKKEIYISGHFDRFVSIISEICQEKKVRLNLIQHGCIQIFDKSLIKNKISGTIYYMFEFSIPYFRTFLDIKDDFIFKKVEMYNSKFSNIYNANEDIIIFGCQDVRQDFNFKILNFLVDNFVDNIIHIIPHPREDHEIYRSKYTQSNVRITSEKPLNANLFISRFSTLGIEYSMLGVKTVFINLDHINMDFILSGNYEVYNNLNNFKLNFIEV